MQAPPERLGSFYLGAEYNLDTGQRLENWVNYDARDLTTHSICVGMTGSGKTGLCLSLLEEAAIDKVPTIIIDPKGDITNLLLQFPELQPEDFAPWINADDARRKGTSPEEYAASVAQLWRDGLANWGIGPERIKLLQESAEFAIYTPGSDAGLPISILGSLSAPNLNFDDNAEAIRERISGTVAALLGLIGLKADPIRSREAILLSNIFEHYWSHHKDLDLAQLIMAIQDPPVRQMGVFDVDTFFPEKDRLSLAMDFNNLLASPAFQNWLQGDALDIDRLLYTKGGQPRHSIFYIAHLGDSERMFFVTLLLESMVTWMRAQGGTTSLRALLYFDEIFGFMPPTAQPPSKRPLLRLLKQARAFGLGCMLVTQNPVDLDYKGLTNAGTWFIGKLQAERDKIRLLEGLKGAIAEAGGDTTIDYAALLSRLGSRVFLMHNVHQNRPVVFQTRWAMSYLRGPLTRNQIKKLMGKRKRRRQPTVEAVAMAPTVPSKPVTSEAIDPSLAAPQGFAGEAPLLESNVPHFYLPLTLPEREAVYQLGLQVGPQLTVERVQLTYEPGILGIAQVRFVDRKRSVNEQVDKLLLAPPPDSMLPLDWGTSKELPVTPEMLVDQPEAVPQEKGPFFADTPEQANNVRELKALQKQLSDWLYYNSSRKLLAHPDLGLFQHPDENEHQFHIRVQQAAKENRDAEVDKLEKRYQAKFDKLDDRLHKLEQDQADDQAEYSALQREELLEHGKSVVNFILNRRSKRRSSRSAANRRKDRIKRSIEATEENIARVQEDIDSLETELRHATDEITHKWSDILNNITVDEITPRRTDVTVQMVALVWLPSWQVNYNDTVNSYQTIIAAYPLPLSAEDDG
jgi:hypothetical protein